MKYFRLQNGQAVCRGTGNYTHSSGFRVVVFHAAFIDKDWSKDFGIVRSKITAR